MRYEHHINSKLLNQQVTVDLIGCGGNGSQMLTGLARLDRAMVARGHPGGLFVRTFDSDTVSQSNVGRQLFSPSDVGMNKATVLTHRVNSFFGLNWCAVPRHHDGRSDAHILISCVDTRAARAGIAGNFYGCYWLDLGNRQHDGQVFLGETEATYTRRSTRDAYRLPLVSELFPEIIDASLDGIDDGPSCSLAEALEKQSLFINQGVVTFALDLLDQLFHYGSIQHHGVFVDMKHGRVQSAQIDPEAWKRLNPALIGTIRASARQNGKTIKKAA